MATYTWYSSVATAAIKEDVLDKIIMLDPYDRILLNGFAKKSATGVKHEWLEDTFAAPAANAQIEGSDATAAAVTGQTRNSNYCQIFRQTIQVSDTMKAVSQYGKRGEVGYQKLKKAQELANDIERALITGTSATGAAATARTLAGVLASITTNVLAYTGAAVLTAADATFEKNYNDLVEDVYEAGGSPKWAVMAGFQKRRTSTWTTNITRNIDAASKKQVNTITVYDGDFDIQQLIKHRIWGLIAKDTLAVVDPKYWAIARLRPTSTEKLGKDGSSEKWMLESELTLEALSEAANGKMSGLATTV